MLLSVNCYSPPYTHISECLRGATLRPIQLRIYLLRVQLVYCLLQIQLNIVLKIQQNDTIITYLAVAAAAVCICFVSVSQTL